MSRLCLNGSVIFLGHAAVPPHHRETWCWPGRGILIRRPLQVRMRQSTADKVSFTVLALLTTWGDDVLRHCTLSPYRSCCVGFWCSCMTRNQQKKQPNMLMITLKCPLKNDSNDSVLPSSIQYPVLFFLPILLLNCRYVPEFPCSEPLRSSSYWPSLRTVLPWLCSCLCLKKTAITPTQAWWVLINNNPSYNPSHKIMDPRHQYGTNTVKTIPSGY